MFIPAAAGTLFKLPAADVALFRLLSIIGRLFKLLFAEDEPLFEWLSVVPEPLFKSLSVAPGALSKLVTVDNVLSLLLAKEAKSLPVLIPDTVQLSELLPPIL